MEELALIKLKSTRNDIVKTLKGMIGHLSLWKLSNLLRGF